MARRSRLRSGTTRFVGAITGLIVYLLVVLVVNPGGQDPTNNTGMIWLVVGAVVCMGVAAWFLPWIRKRFSAHYARRKAKLGR
jgi:protein-S-isoprenylcysteine O-methyltransferase Ste14